MLALLSCGSKNEPFKPEPTPEPTLQTLSLASLPFNADGIWTGAREENPVKTDGFQFSHSISEYGTIEGFTPACQEDIAYTPPMYQHEFRVVTAGGVEGPGTPYMVGFWSSQESNTPQQRSCTLRRTDSQPFTPHHVMCTNTCYTYYTMIDGDDFTRPFAEGDWLRVTAHGMGTDGVLREADFYLANVTSKKAAEGIINTWKYFDLTPLGEVNLIYFTMSSTDNGQWGMNTPAYFALDQFTVITDANHTTEQ